MRMSATTTSERSRRSLAHEGLTNPSPGDLVAAVGGRWCQSLAQEDGVVNDQNAQDSRLKCGRSPVRDVMVSLPSTPVEGRIDQAGQAVSAAGLGALS